MQFPFLFDVEKNIDAAIKESHKPNPNKKFIKKQTKAAFNKSLLSGAVYGAVLGVAVIAPIRIVVNYNRNDS